MKQSSVTIKNQLAGRIQELRIKKGWSQRELAERVGTAQDSISRLEKGTQMPTIERLNNLAIALECELQILISPKKK